MNGFGSITLIADRLFRVGDRVQIDTFDGSVEAIGLRSTRIRTLEGHLVPIPHKTVADAAINNVNLRPNIRQLMTLRLTYDTTPDQMEEAAEILRESFAKHPQPTTRGFTGRTTRRVHSISSSCTGARVPTTKISWLRFRS